MIVPGGVIYLCNVPWDRNYNHISDGVSASALISAALTAFTSYTYSRKDKILKLGVCADDITGANYVVYKNIGFTSKYYYAFITKVEFISENSCYVYIETDVWQTWKDNITFGHCFVEREHVLDDAIGVNTVPENLDTGDIVLTEDYTRAFVNGLHIMIAVTEFYNGSSWEDAVGGYYGGIFSGCKIFSFTDAGNAAAFLSNYLLNDAEKAGAIVAIWQMPDDFFTMTGTAVNHSTSVTEKAVNAPERPTAIDGYTPKNQKLLTYPYISLFVHNNSGGAAIFKYEDFAATTPVFHVYGTILPNPTLKIYPYNLLRGSSYGWSEGLTLAGFPMCSWNTDTYKTWLAQNAGSLAIQGVGAVGSIIGGAVAQSPINIYQGVMGAASIIANIHQHSLIPNQMNGSLNAGDANNSTLKNDFFIHLKTIKAEYARIIDEFFTMFGYKVARVKIPDFTTRFIYNYVKTLDCVIKGGLPTEDKLKLESIFNHGVTVWHDPANIGDYSIDNTRGD